MEICDRYTVLRDGRLVGSGAVAETTIDGIIRLMVGREVNALFAHRAAADAGRGGARGRGPDAARQRAATRTRPSSTTSRFSVRRGEILGIAGLVGAGRTEMARAIFGADPFDSGRVLVDGEPVDIRSPQDAIRHGIGLVPEDRKQQALFLALAIRMNCQHGGARPHLRAGAASSTSARSAAGRGIPPGAEHPHGGPGPAGRTTFPAATSRRWCWRAGWRCGRRC